MVISSWKNHSIYMKLPKLLPLLLFWFGVPAGQAAEPCCQLTAKILNVGVVNFEPFVIQQSKNGIHIEIIQAIFDRLPGYQARYIYLANHRLTAAIHSGQLDVASNITPSSMLNAHLSQGLFYYQDVAVSLKASGIKIERVDDLSRGRIAAYQGARQLLGEKFRRVVSLNPDYHEYHLALSTTALLVRQRVDVRVGDVSIFYYDLNRPTNRNLDVGDYNISYLWPNVVTHLAFKDEFLRDRVELIISDLKRQGVIDKIYLKYRKPLGLAGLPRASSE